MGHDAGWLCSRSPVRPFACGGQCSSVLMSQFVCSSSHAQKKCVYSLSRLLYFISPCSIADHSFGLFVVVCLLITYAHQILDREVGELWPVVVKYDHAFGNKSHRHKLDEVFLTGTCRNNGVVVNAHVRPFGGYFPHPSAICVPHLIAVQCYLYARQVLR